MSTRESEQRPSAVTDEVIWQVLEEALDSGQKIAPDKFKSRVIQLQGQPMNDMCDSELEESPEEVAFQDEVDDALSEIYEALQQEAYEQGYANAYPPAYEHAIANGNDITTAKDIAHDKAHTLATDTSEEIARDSLDDAPHDVLMDSYRKHVSAWLASEG